MAANLFTYQTRQLFVLLLLYKETGRVGSVLKIQRQEKETASHVENWKNSVYRCCWLLLWEGGGSLAVGCCKGGREALLLLAVAKGGGGMLFLIAVFCSVSLLLCRLFFCWITFSLPSLFKKRATERRTTGAIRSGHKKGEK